MIQSIGVILKCDGIHRGPIAHGQPCFSELEFFSEEAAKVYMEVNGWVEVIDTSVPNWPRRKHFCREHAYQAKEIS